MPRSVELDAAATTNALRRLARRLERAPKSKDLSPELSAAVRHHFGSLRQGRQEAKIGEPTKRAWTDEKIVRELRRLHRAGVTISKPGLAAAGHDGVAGAAQRYLGGMTRARRLAGLPEPSRQGSEREAWSEERVLEEIGGRLRRGRSVAFSRVPLKLRLAGTRYFGSWRSAVEAADVVYASIRLRRAGYEQREVLERLRKVARAAPTMKRTTLPRRHHALYKATLRLFGSVERAASKAGLRNWPRADYQRWSRARVLRELRSSGPGPIVDKTLAAACARFFASVPAARRAATIGKSPTTNKRRS